MDCRPEELFARQSPDGFRLPKDINNTYIHCDFMKNDFYISCDFKGLEDIAIKTTNDTVKETVNYLKTLKHIKVLFEFFLHSILKYRKNIDKIYEEKGLEWDKFCEILLDYYCCRVILFKKAIPICYTEQLFKN
jgi:hypothetical protein